MCFTGCTDADLPGEVAQPDAGIEVLAQVNVSLRLSGSGPQTMAGDYELGKTDAETRIARLLAIIVNLDAQGNEIPDKRAVAEVLSPGSTTVTFHLRTTSGPKHIYLAANMDVSAAIAAIYGKASDAATGTDYEAAISKFVKLGSADQANGNRPGSEIAMSGQVAAGQHVPGRIDIPAPATPGDVVSVSDLSVTLKRTVAKVLLTCNMVSDKTGGESGGNYVLIRDPQSTQLSPPGSANNANNDYNGWMNIHDVWFALNNTSKRLYLVQHTGTVGGTTCVIDPNFGLSDYLRRDNGIYTPIMEEDIYGKNFVSFESTQLKLPSEPSGIPFDPSTCRMQALAYDAGKANPSQPDNHYTEGLYCLENTVYNDLDDLSPDEAESIPRMGSTYVVIGARYVPKFIYDDTEADSGTDIKGTACTDYASAMNMLASVTGEDRDGNTTTYPAGTFFYYYDGAAARFCTYKGMMKWIELSKESLTPILRENFNDYVAGWGYYTTYITGEQSTEPDGYGRRPLCFKDKDGVMRNTYYLLQASLFYVPGSNLPSNDLIMVNSQRLEWVPRGETDVVVKPK